MTKSAVGDCRGAVSGGGLAAVGGPVMDWRRIRVDVQTDRPYSLIAQLRPDWPLDSLRFKVFTDGITNKLIGCFLDSEPNDMVLVRVYGQNTELLIDRKAETANFLLLQKAGYAPRLYATFNNGLAYAYVPGEVLTSNMVKNPSIYPLVARMLAKLHNVECGPSMSKEPVIWRRTYHYLSLIPPTFTKCQLQKRFVECFPDGIDFLKQELQELQQNLSDIKTDVVFCHNDLLLGNIIHNDGKVTFIDYEYAAYNYQAYDIGNHFAEFAGVSEVDYSRYPNKEFQISWLNIYLSEYNQCKNAAGTVTFSEINDLYLEVNKFSLASHLHWAIWALVQAHHSAIDFDFIGYAFTRVHEYYIKKKKFLELESIS